MTLEQETPVVLSITDPVCVLDREGFVAYLDQSAGVLFACDAQRTRGLHHHDVSALAPVSDEACDVCDALDRGRRGFPISATELTVPANGDVRWIHATRVPLWEQGTFCGLGLILLDRTQEKRLGEALNALVTLLARTAMCDPDERPMRVIPGDAQSDRGRGLVLTAREREVLHCLVAGMNARQIAARLHITPKTSRNHVQNVLHKLDVHSKAQAVAHAVARQLVDSSELLSLLADTEHWDSSERSA